MGENWASRLRLHQIIHCRSVPTRCDILLDVTDPIFTFYFSYTFASPLMRLKVSSGSSVSVSFGPKRTRSYNLWKRVPWKQHCEIGCWDSQCDERGYSDRHCWDWCSSSMKSSIKRPRSRNKGHEEEQRMRGGVWPLQKRLLLVFDSLNEVSLASNNEMDVKRVVILPYGPARTF